MSRPRLLQAKPRRLRDAQPLASKPTRGSRVLDYGCIGANWNRFGIARKQKAVIGQGGRGFTSLERGRPATACTLTQRFFVWRQNFELFCGNQKIKRRSRQFLLAKQGGPALEALAFEHLFSACHAGANCDPKNCREIPRGGGRVHVTASRVAT